MSYQLVIKETFKGGPISNEKINFSRSISETNLREVSVDIMKSLKEINDRYRVIRTWDEVLDGRLVKKVLFERPGHHGRLLRIHEVSRSYKTHRDEFSLI